jgi:D-serine deaminase-like pyridoxal phosphate-dependent protein
MTRSPADIGTPVAEIDTPALVVDLDAYERNLDRMAAAVARTPARLRPHAKTHKCPVVALHQMARGAVGACCQKVAEAEAMVDGGVGNVLVSNEIVGARKIARLVALARRAEVAVCADDPGNVDDLDRAARDAGLRLPVLVEVDVGAGRCGVAPGRPAVELARRVAAARGLRFAGLQAYQGAAQHIADEGQRRSVMTEALSRVADTRDALRAAGLPAETVSGAGTGTFDLEAASGLYTEIQAGSYPFMDVDYRRVAGAPQQFEHALFVAATVMSRAAPDRAIVDAGLKALAVDSGMPRVHGRPDLEFARASDEHGRLVVRDPAAGPRVGDRLWLVPGHCDPTINLYDWYVAVRGGLEAGRVEALWAITARGAVL